MDDKDLNRVVSLKKLAPYRDPAVVKRAEQRLQEIKAKANAYILLLAAGLQLLLFDW
jgi:hypothetical protein